MFDIICTPAQRRAAIEALGLDPDLTISVSLATDWASATIADTSGDRLHMVDGQLATTTISGPIAEPAAPAESVTDQPTA